MIRTTLIAVAVAFAQQAAAHGEHIWIMQNPKTKWCCGPIDCHTVPRGTVQEMKFGWQFVYDGRLYRVHRGAKGIYTSVDADFHICLKPDKTRRCFFRPVGVG